MIRAFAITSILVSLAILVGGRSDPIKVGEYQAASFEQERVDKKIKAFLERLAKEPRSTRGAIAFVNGFMFKGSCVDNRLVEDDRLERSIRSSIPRALRDRIVVVPAEQWGLMAEATFYLVPPGARLPPKIVRVVDPPCCCHSIRIEAPFEVGSDTATVRYRLILRPSKSRTRPKVKWNVAGGSVIFGKDILEIRVKPDATANEIIVTATAVSATGCGCDQEISHSTRIVAK